MNKKNLISSASGFVVGLGLMLGLVFLLMGCAGCWAIPKDHFELPKEVDTRTTYAELMALVPGVNKKVVTQVTEEWLRIDVAWGGGSPVARFNLRGDPIENLPEADIDWLYVYDTTTRFEDYPWLFVGMPYDEALDAAGDQGAQLDWTDTEKPSWAEDWAELVLPGRPNYHFHVEDDVVTQISVEF